ncbi:MAG: hypothetical protein JST16_12075 [Bdellovibrionales bacterium]|nr:hypothetical protein [Bdellovibrionales bacterium]
MAVDVADPRHLTQDDMMAIHLSTAATFDPKRLSVRDACRDSVAANYDYDRFANSISNTELAPYALSMSPRLSDRELGLQLQLSEVLDIHQDAKLRRQGRSFRIPAIAGGSWADKFRGVQDTGQSKAPEEMPASFAKRIQTQAQSKMIFRNLGNLAWVGCGSDTSLGCGNAFRDTVLRMQVFDGNGKLLALPQEISEFGSDPIYTRVLPQFTTELLKRYDDLKAGKKVRPGNLHDDLVRSFVAAGVHEPQLSHAVWVVLGLYGARGASMSPLLELANRQNYPAFAGLATLASTVSVLDAYAADHNQAAYSLPANVASACAHTRPYHFWLSAYLAQKLREKKYAPRDIQNAVHALGALYEEFAPTTTNWNTGADGALERPVAHFENVETQKDIAYNDVGAAWALTGSKINLDNCLSNIFNAAKAAPPPEWSTRANLNLFKPGTLSPVRLLDMISDGRLSHYVQWRERLGSEACLKTLRAK